MSYVRSLLGNGLPDSTRPPFKQGRSEPVFEQLDPHSQDLHAKPLSGIVYCNCDARDMFMSGAKSRTIPPLRVSEELRADAESVLAPGETLSAFVMDAVSRTIDFRKSQLDFLARGMASAERARAQGGYVQADKVIARLRKRLANAQRVRK